jgi:hypothetical protein
MDPRAPICDCFLRGNMPRAILTAKYAWRRDATGQGHRGHSAHGVLFLGRNFLLQKTTPPLRAYNEDGTRYGADIDFFKDFPNLEEAHVDDFAAGPADTTLIATMLEYGPRIRKHQILTYDSAGNLRSLFNINDVEAMTTDDHGDIYC